MTKMFIPVAVVAVTAATLFTNRPAVAGDDTPLSMANALPSPSRFRAGGGAGAAPLTYAAHVRYRNGEAIDLTYNSRAWFYLIDRDRRHVTRTYSTGGAVLYTSRDGIRWDKIDYGRSSASHPPPAKPYASDRLPAITVDRPLPDVSISKHRYRRFGTYARSRSWHSTKLVQTCLIDVASGLLWKCDRPGLFDVTFDRYDDPRNEFTLPPAAQHARDLTDSFERSHR